MLLVVVVGVVMIFIFFFCFIAVLVLGIINFRIGILNFDLIFFKVKVELVL